MIVIISPAKTFEQLKVNEELETTQPPFLEQTKELIERLKLFSVEELGKEMKMSPTLAQTNHKRFQHFFDNPTHPAILSYHGAMYKGMEIETYTKEQLEYVGEAVRILSGLYGMVRPFDLIEEYRLEMAMKLANSKGKNLYQFWREILTEKIIEEIEHSIGEKVLIDLCSTEYSKALDLKKIAKKYPIVMITFKERKGDTYKLIGTYAKRARGLMIQYLAKNKVNQLEGIKGFNLEGYVFNDDLSTESEFVFTRG
ncbi:MAG: YaaA family protein [Bacillaceae bacterium]